MGAADDARGILERGVKRAGIGQVGDAWPHVDAGGRPFGCIPYYGNQWRRIADQRSAECNATAARSADNVYLDRAHHDATFKPSWPPRIKSGEALTMDG